MSMKRRAEAGQDSFWIATADVALSPGHPFYEALNRLLAKHGFDRFAEDLCEPYYKEGGRPSIEPGMCFRMLFIGCFEDTGSARGI